MPPLSAKARASLPDRAFAYVDSAGRRRLPINDEAHVRNALARFERVSFENAAAREAARKRLLNAAKKYGIVPVGFIAGQLRSERARPASAALPSGSVTFLLTDIEGSTALLRQLGERYAKLLRDVRTIVRRSVVRAGGREVDARADEFFAVFERPMGAIEAAVAMQRTLGGRKWPDELECRIRAGVHGGRPTLTDSGYIGLSVHTAARVCAAAHGGQIVVTSETVAAVQGSLPDGVLFRSLGKRRLPGLTLSHALYQVEAQGLLSEFPPLPRVRAKAR